ncbi:glycosyltransferase family 39 protein [Butyrivibrio sp. X503]|uniref:glycosyltransferase family 39 protein n=1 Tax=Butyrivibrio sp. X503 TaxID=2364878 RepID=UPI001314A68C|nr:glycosyltransferase family 39 protein [Butyrivibrio sp. X503]
MKLKNAFYKIIVICMIIAAALTLGCSILTTVYYDVDGEIQVDWPHYQKENIPLLLISLAAVLVIFILLQKKNVFGHYKKWMTAGLIFVAAYCFMLIFAIRPLPVNDSKTLDDIIISFVSGDYSELTTTGGYLFIWPFQLGYVLFGELVTNVFGVGNYLAWDLLQLVSIVITIWLIYKITWECFEDKDICGMAALLSCGALFFYNYVTYIYGDILSMAPQTAALYALILFMKRKKFRYGLLSGVFISFSIMLKTNCKITLIALIMMLFMSEIRKKESVKNSEEKAPEKTVGSRIISHSLIRRIVIAAFMLVGMLLIDTAVNVHYCRLTGLSEIPKGSPSASHIAMGLQESDLEDGWYNGYNYHVFGENNYDTDKTKAAAIENIKETLSGFVKRPLHGGKFFVRKYLTQWADPVCISTHNLDLVSRHHDTSALGTSLVYGRGSEVLKWIMNVFMTLCYLGVLIYLLSIFRKKSVTDSEMLMLLLIFGGIVFHEFWEGSSRYAMRYYIYYLPFAACGLKVLSGRFFLHKLK